MLVPIATNALLASDHFPQATDTWEEKTNEEKTWHEWKDTYFSANESHENRLRDVGDTCDQDFGTPTSNNPKNPYHTRIYLGYFNNMSDASANEAIAGSLVAAGISSMAKILENLNLLNAMVVMEVASLYADMENSSSKTANSNLDGLLSNTGYCWSHGYKVSKTHTRESCTKRKYGHKKKATRRNPMGVSDWNKVWGTWQEVSDHYNTKLNIPTNVNFSCLKWM